MKTIKMLLVFALLLLGYTHSFAQQLNKQDILHREGLLWKIDKAEMRSSYLFGTMHVSDKRVTALNAVVEKAFINADQFVMEMLLNDQAIAVINQASYFSNGKSLPDLIDLQSYKRLLALLKNRLYLTESTIQNMKPWAVLMLLMVPAEQYFQSSDALDMQLFKRASQLNKKLGGLETAQEQVNVFDELSLSDQIWLLNRAVEDVDATDKLFPEMLKAYTAGDLAELVMIQQKTRVVESDVDDRFMLRLLDLRNLRMVERMQPYLHKGNAFIAVGALHLPGETGLLQLLEKRGYEVTPVH